MIELVAMLLMEMTIELWPAQLFEMQIVALLLAQKTVLLLTAMFLLQMNFDCSLKFE